MSKVVFTLPIPEPKVRKTSVKASQTHRDKTKYTRKNKHKAPYGAFFMAELHQMPRHRQVGQPFVL